MLKNGIQAPDFKFINLEGEEVRLSDYLGKKVVLYFYPRDNTPGCTRQAVAFANEYDKYLEKDIIVIGVSKDSEKSHDKFREKHSLPFILISDPDLDVIQMYDVWQEKKMYGKTSMGVVRTTYLINEKGIIEKVYEKVKPDNNALEILEYVNS